MVVIKPPSDNLGSRQRALNARANEATAKNMPFDVVREEPESSDVDKLYKIDVAAKYKNLDYITEILKSGDSLYTSRALKKCQWLYTDEYSNVIDLEYLQQNIFPSTSTKMKRKITKTAAVNVKNPQRAIKFFHYCLKERMMNTAFTCLLYTTDEFKLDQLRNNKEQTFRKLEDKDTLYFRLFVGKSFVLLEALLNFILIPLKKSNTVRQFKSWFYQCEEKYLDLVEKYVITNYGLRTDKFNIKLSEAIMIKHKHRVLTKPKFYLYTVNTKVLVQNSTIDDAKVYAKALLPNKADEFWTGNKYVSFKSVFQIIPHDKTYDFFKSYFAEHYPNDEFDMHSEFYKQEYYKFMSIEQQEEWAQRHLKSERQILGVGRDYLWYRFIKFDVAFEEIKKLISITKDAGKRSDMINVIIKTARNNRDFEELLKYYNKRHINETLQHKDMLLIEILSNKNVFEFDDDCWREFYPLLLGVARCVNLDMIRLNYKTVALIYFIVHKKCLPEILTQFLTEQFDVHYVTQHLRNICHEKQKILHDFFFNFYMNIITESKNKTSEFKNYKNNVAPKYQRYYQNVDKSMSLFNRRVEPTRVRYYETPRKHINMSKKVRYICRNEISGRSLIRDLKKDEKEVIVKLPRVKNHLECSSIKMNTFLRKLKIYFPNDDVTKIYLDMFVSLINNGYVPRPTKNAANALKTGVNAIFQMANEDIKTDFMKKYYPVGTKIERKNLGIQHLRIQRAICRYACLSRQPVPLTAMLMFMKPGYVKNCLHIFSTYLALLPRPMCHQFVTLIIDAPVSIQKHAIRLAFRCFNPEDLKETISNIWNNTKNITLRSVIYKAFVKKVIDSEDKLVYDMLETVTLDINQDDEDVIFDIMVSNKEMLPEQFLGNYIKACWKMIRMFKNIEPNITRKKKVLSFMRDQIHLLNQDFISTIVDEHITTMVLEHKLEQIHYKEDIYTLYDEQWTLISHLIVHNHGTDHISEKCVQLTKYLVRKMIENWHKIAFDAFVYQKCCWNFLSVLKEISLEEKYRNIECTIPIFNSIMEIFDSDIQFNDSYLLVWELKLILITATLIKKNRAFYKNGKQLEVVTDSTKEFGEKVGELMSHLVQSNSYFISCSSKVSDKIKEYVQALLKLIYKEVSDDYRDWKEHLYKALITAAASLVQFEISETYLIAIELVPTDCDECNHDLFKRLVNKLEKFPNIEVQFLLRQKLQKYCDRKQCVLQSPDPCNIN